MPGKASKLVNDLSNIPEIVGALGLSISEAQKAFNLDYLDNIERLLGMAKSLSNVPDNLSDEEKQKIEEFRGDVTEMLKMLAPPRYQFTETTLAVRLDLAQTMDFSGTAGFSVGYGGVALNAAMTVGYGYDYRAAAEVRTTLHAESADKTTFKILLGRAAKFSEKALQLPEGAAIDKDLLDKTYAIVEKLTGVEREKPDLPTGSG